MQDSYLYPHSGFDAHSGSEVHIFTSVEYPVCSNFAGFSKIINPSISNEVIQDDISKEKAKDIQFLKSNIFTVQIFPNPNHGEFNISIENSLNDEVTITLENLIGEILWKNKINQKDISVDFDFLTKGIYICKNR